MKNSIYSSENRKDAKSSQGVKLPLWNSQSKARDAQEGGRIYQSDHYARWSPGKLVSRLKLQNQHIMTPMSAMSRGNAPRLLINNSEPEIPNMVKNRQFNPKFMSPGSLNIEKIKTPEFCFNRQKRGQRGVSAFGRNKQTFSQIVETRKRFEGAENGKHLGKTLKKSGSIKMKSQRFLRSNQQRASVNLVSSRVIACRKRKYTTFEPDRGRIMAKQKSVIFGQDLQSQQLRRLFLSESNNSSSLSSSDGVRKVRNLSSSGSSVSSSSESVKNIIFDDKALEMEKEGSKKI